MSRLSDEMIEELDALMDDLTPGERGDFEAYLDMDHPGVFFFKQKTAYEIGVRLVGSEMCIRDRNHITIFFVHTSHQ